MKARDVFEKLDPKHAIASLGRWVGREREATAQVVAHLAVLERERIHIGAGYASLFVYCHEGLGYSRDAAYKRTRAARAALEHPEILDYLESGELTLSAVLAMAKHLRGDSTGAS